MFAFSFALLKFGGDVCWVCLIWFLLVWGLSGDCFGAEFLVIFYAT